MTPTPLPAEGPRESDRGSLPSPEDHDAVVRLLGREPFTDFRVVVRCPFGRPAVLANDPVDRNGRPFPTRHWLACRHLHAAVSRLEAAGGVRDLEGDERMVDALRAVHAAHRTVHAGHNVGGVGDDRRVKCLHAQLAHALAVGGNPIGDWIAKRAEIGWPAVCCIESAEESS